MIEAHLSYAPDILFLSLMLQYFFLLFLSSQPKTMQRFLHLNKGPSLISAQIHTEPRSLKNHWVSSLSTSLCLPPPNPYPDLILRAALGDLYCPYSILLWRKWVLEWLSNNSSSYKQQMLKKKKSNAISISQTLKQIRDIISSTRI